MVYKGAFSQEIEFEMADGCEEDSHNSFEKKKKKKKTRKKRWS